MLLSADARLTDGKTSPGLEGELTVSDGLAGLLAGSGLAPVQDADGSYTLRRVAQTDAAEPPQPPNGEPRTPAEEELTVLPVLTVTAQPWDETSYNVPNATTATKTDTPIFDTPLSIQVVPQQILKDQQAVRLQDALKNISGVQFTPSSGNEVDAFVIRGFPIFDNARFRNGRRFPGTFKSDLANIEIEVLKEPAAVLYGRLEPGGLVNLVTKKPLEEPYYALQQQFGSYDFYRTTVDATGPIDAAKTLLYRFNLGYTDTQSFRDELFDQALLIAPTLTWRPTEATEINLSYDHREEDLLFDSGIPVRFANGNNRIPPISISSQFTEPGAHDESDYNLVDLNASHHFHAFDADWTARAGFQYQKIDNKALDISGGSVQADGRTVNRFITFGEASEDIYQVFLDFTGEFQLGGTKHTVLVGWDFYEDEDEIPSFFFDGAGQFGDATTVDLFNPQRLGREVLAAILAQPPEFFSKSGQRWHGVYFQDQVTFWDKLHLLGGGRYDWAESSSGDSGVSFDECPKGHPER